MERLTNLIDMQVIRERVLQAVRAAMMLIVPPFALRRITGGWPSVTSVTHPSEWMGYVQNASSQDWGNWVVNTVWMIWLLLALVWSAVAVRSFLSSVSSVPSVGVKDGQSLMSWKAPEDMDWGQAALVSLGDSTAGDALRRLNHGRLMGDGTVIGDSTGFVRGGWWLLLPGDGLVSFSSYAGRSVPSLSRLPSAPPVAPPLTVPAQPSESSALAARQSEYENLRLEAERRRVAEAERRRRDEENRSAFEAERRQLAEERRKLLDEEWQSLWEEKERTEIDRERVELEQQRAELQRQKSLAEIDRKRREMERDAAEREAAQKLEPAKRDAEELKAAEESRAAAARLEEAREAARQEEAREAARQEEAREAARQEEARAAAQQAVYTTATEEEYDEEEEEEEERASLLKRFGRKKVTDESETTAVEPETEQPDAEEPSETEESASRSRSLLGKAIGIIGRKPRSSSSGMRIDHTQTFRQAWAVMAYPSDRERNVSGLTHPPVAAAFPDVVAVVVTPEGLAALYEDDATKPPAGWLMGADNRSWYLRHDKPDPSPIAPPNPLLVPMGVTGGNCDWWLNLRTVRVVLEGSEAEQLRGLWSEHVGSSAVSGDIVGDGDSTCVVIADRGVVRLDRYGLTLGSPLSNASDPLVGTVEDPAVGFAGGVDGGEGDVGLSESEEEWGDDWWDEKWRKDDFVWGKRDDDNGDGGGGPVAGRASSGGGPSSGGGDVAVDGTAGGSASAAEADNSELVGDVVSVERPVDGRGVSDDAAAVAPEVEARELVGDDADIDGGSYVVGDDGVDGETDAADWVDDDSSGVDVMGSDVSWSDLLGDVLDIEIEDSDESGGIDGVDGIEEFDEIDRGGDSDEIAGVDEPEKIIDVSMDADEPVDVDDITELSEPDDEEIDRPAAVEIDEAPDAADEKVDIEDISDAADEKVEIEDISDAADEKVDIEDISDAADEKVDIEDISDAADEKVDTDEIKELAETTVDVDVEETGEDSDGAIVDITGGGTASGDPVVSSGKTYWGGPRPEDLFIPDDMDYFSATDDTEETDIVSISGVPFQATVPEETPAEEETYIEATTPDAEETYIEATTPDAEETYIEATTPDAEEIEDAEEEETLDVELIDEAAEETPVVEAAPYTGEATDAAEDDESYYSTSTPERRSTFTTPRTDEPVDIYQPTEAEKKVDSYELKQTTDSETEEDWWQDTDWDNIFEEDATTGTYPAADETVSDEPATLEAGAEEAPDETVSDEPATLEADAEEAPDETVSDEPATLEADAAEAPDETVSEEPATETETLADKNKTTKKGLLGRLMKRQSDPGKQKAESSEPPATFVEETAGIPDISSETPTPVVSDATNETTDETASAETVIETDMELPTETASEPGTVLETRVEEEATPVLETKADPEPETESTPAEAETDSEADADVTQEQEYQIEAAPAEEPDPHLSDWLQGVLTTVSRKQQENPDLLETDDGGGATWTAQIIKQRVENLPITLAEETTEPATTETDPHTDDTQQTSQPKKAAIKYTTPAGAPIETTTPKPRPTPKSQSGMKQLKKIVVINENETPPAAAPPASPQEATLPTPAAPAAQTPPPAAPPAAQPAPPVALIPHTPAFQTNIHQTHTIHMLRTPPVILEGNNPMPLTRDAIHTVAVIHQGINEMNDVIRYVYGKDGADNPAAYLHSYLDIISRLTESGLITSTGSGLTTVGRWNTDWDTLINAINTNDLSTIRASAGVILGTRHDGQINLDPIVWTATVAQIPLSEQDTNKLLYLPYKIAEQPAEQPSTSIHQLYPQ